MHDASKNGAKKDNACLECPLGLICTSRGTETIVVEVYLCVRCRLEEVRITMDTGKIVSSEPDVSVPTDCPRLKEHVEHQVQSDAGFQYVCSKCQNKPVTAEEKKLIEKIVNKPLPGDDKWPKP